MEIIKAKILPYIKKEHLFTDSFTHPIHFWCTAAVCKEFGSVRITSALECAAPSVILTTPPSTAKTISSTVLTPSPSSVHQTTAITSSRSVPALLYYVFSPFYFRALLTPYIQKPFRFEIKSFT